MANPVSGVSSAHHVSDVAQAHQNPQVAKQSVPKIATAPHDTVEISAAGQAASQSKPIANPQKQSEKAAQNGNK